MAPPSTGQVTCYSTEKIIFLFIRFNALTASATVDINTKFSFHFAGAGPCTIKLDSADGHIIIFTGKLPHDRDHTYVSTSMPSFDAFKD